MLDSRSRWLRWLGQRCRADSYVTLLDANYMRWLRAAYRSLDCDMPTIGLTSDMPEIKAAWRVAIQQVDADLLLRLDIVNLEAKRGA